MIGAFRVSRLKSELPILSSRIAIVFMSALVMARLLRSKVGDILC